MKKLKICWLSDSPFICTGFRNQSIALCNYLASKGHEVHYFDHCRAGQTILPGATLEDGTKLNFKIYGNGMRPYFQDIMNQRLKEIKPDFFGVLLDTFMLMDSGFLQQDLSPAKTAIWFPSDGGLGMPYNPGRDCSNILRKVNMPISMSKFAQKQALDYHNLKTGYIPHGIDTSLFKRYPDEQRDALRKGMGLSDKFVIGAVFRNQPRKMSDRIFKIMNILKEKIPNAVLLCHTDPMDPATYFDVFEMIKRYNLQNRVLFTGMTWNKGWEDKRMPDVYNVMDLKIDTTCLTPETEILTINGTKQIKDIEKGEIVLTHTGEYKKVLDKYIFDKNEEILEIDCAYIPKIKITKNHKILAIKNNYLMNKSRFKKATKKIKDRLEFCRADELKRGNLLAIPKIKIENKSIYSEDLMELFGIYLAEGCISQKREKPEGIIFCINSNEINLTNKILNIMKKEFNLKGHIFDNSRHRRTIRFYSKNIGIKFKELFGSGSHNKKLPEEFMLIEKVKQLKLISGLWEGDGSVYYSKSKKSTSFDLQLVSKNLIHQIFQLLIRNDFIPSISMQKRQSDVWRLRINGSQKFKFANIINREIKDKGRLNQIGIQDENYVYILIKNIKTTNYYGDVYDLLIEDNHTYNSYFSIHNSGEGFGITIAEAMACEVPQLVTDYTTTQELIKDNQCGEGIKLSGTEQVNLWDFHSKKYDEMMMNGTILGSWHVERGICDVYDATEKIVKLYKNPELMREMGRNGRKAVEQFYDFNKVIGPAWENMILRLCNG